MIYLISFLILLIAVYGFIVTSKLKQLEQKYDGVIAVLAGDFDVTSLKQFIENTNAKDPLKQLASNFPLSYEELEIIRNECFGILNAIYANVYPPYPPNRERTVLGYYWSNNDILEMPSYTILKTKENNNAILLLGEEKLSKKGILIIAGSNKEFVEINLMSGPNYQTLIASSEVLKMLSDYRKQRK